jgi:hypothetical protein
MTDMLINFKARLFGDSGQAFPTLCEKKEKADIYKILKDSIDEALKELSDFTAVIRERVTEDEESDGYLFKKIFSILAPASITISQWADKYRRLSSESSARPEHGTQKRPHISGKLWTPFPYEHTKSCGHVSRADRENRRIYFEPIGYFMHYDPARSWLCSLLSRWRKFF